MDRDVKTAICQWDITVHIFKTTQTYHLKTHPPPSSSMYRNKSHYLAIIGPLNIVYSWTNTDLGGFSLIGESES